MIVLVFLYGWLVFVSLTNLVLMRRPRGEGAICFEVMIPARNEAGNLARVVSPLVAAGVFVTVFDDESTDGTGSVADGLGARVLAPDESLPEGWTGKNRACAALAESASSEWVVFLDADTVPSPSFGACLSEFLSTRPGDVRVVTGFPRMLPGRGLEPAYLGWVPWILLATNPFGLVARTGLGHNGFTNGQFVAWRRETLAEVRPFESVRGAILEDVKIGRLLARRKVRVEVVDMSRILTVRMYESLGAAVDGMSKNSAEIGGGFLGSAVLILLFLVLGWGWVLPGGLWLLGLLLLSKFLSDRVVRYPLWTVPFLPLTCLAAALTVVRSLIWKKRGRMQWKGRNYS